MYFLPYIIAKYNFIFSYHYSGNLTSDIILYSKHLRFYIIFLSDFKNTFSCPPLLVFPLSFFTIFIYLMAKGTFRKAQVPVHPIAVP